jgi:hypothetical protein
MLESWAVGAEAGAKRTDPARAAATRPAQRSAHSGSRGDSAAREAAARHCWVTNPPGTPGRWPGVVLEWRRDEGRWQGRVVVVVLDGQAPSMICAWFDQDQLTPAVLP